MPAENFINVAETTLSVAALSTDATLTLLSGASFNVTGQYRIRLDDSLQQTNGIATRYEICRATFNAGNVINGFRTGVDLEGTTAQAWPIGTKVAAIVTAAGLLNIETALLFSDQILAAPTASVTFLAIPATGRSLLLEWQAQDSSGGTGELVLLRMNFDNAANYSYETLASNGTAPQASQGAAQTGLRIGVAPGVTAGLSGSGSVKLFNYAGTVFRKSAVATSHRSDGSVSGIGSEFTAGAWANTAAITSLTVLLGVAGNFITGSRFTLYILP